MNKKRYRKLSVFVAVLLFLSSIPFTGITSAEQDDGGLKDSVIQQLMDDPIVSGNITETFLSVRSVESEDTLVYLNEDNTLYVTVENTGGSTGDDEYVQQITNSVKELESIKNDTDKRIVRKFLQKSIDKLEKASQDVSDGERIKSIKHVKKAVIFLKVAENKGAELGNVTNNITYAVENKVGSIKDEAERSFGSNSTDVWKAKLFYLMGKARLEEDRYTAALALFKQSFKNALKAYECDVHLSLSDIMPSRSDIYIGESTSDDLKAEEEAVLEFTWHPVERGVHYLGFNMTGDYMVYNSPGEIEGENIVI
ncbi:MAG: hypothetical protein R6U61_04750 [Thermoplasmata archaeon]